MRRRSISAKSRLGAVWLMVRFLDCWRPTCVESKALVRGDTSSSSSRSGAIASLARISASPKRPTIFLLERTKNCSRFGYENLAQDGSSKPRRCIARGAETLAAGYKGRGLVGERGNVRQWEARCTSRLVVHDNARTLGMGSGGIWSSGTESIHRSVTGGCSRFNNSVLCATSAEDTVTDTRIDLDSMDKNLDDYEQEYYAEPPSVGSFLDRYHLAREMSRGKSKESQGGLSLDDLEYVGNEDDIFQEPPTFGTFLERYHTAKELSLRQKEMGEDKTEKTKVDGKDASGELHVSNSMPIQWKATTPGKDQKMMNQGAMSPVSPSLSSDSLASPSRRSGWSFLSRPLDEGIASMVDKNPPLTKMESGDIVLDRGEQALHEEDGGMLQRSASSRDRLREVWRQACFERDLVYPKKSFYDNGPEHGSGESISEIISRNEQSVQQQQQQDARK